MTISRDHAGKLLASFLWLAAGTLSSCVGTGLRIVAPSNAPPSTSRWPAGSDSVLAHQGISIGGSGFSGHEIVAAADGVVVSPGVDYCSGCRVRIFNGLNSSNQKIFSDHYHLIEPSVKNGDRVKRGQSLGYIQRGMKTNLPHTHFVVMVEESPKKFAVMDPDDYWFGIDQYKEKLARGDDVEPFTIPCFDPEVNYPNEPLRFTYPVKCK